MSGYLEVKYPFKSNLGLNPFKSWKKQWCILRPSPTSVGGCSLAVYCSEAGSSAGSVEIPSGSVVRRAKSRSRPYAFAVFSSDEPRKPRLLLAGHTLNDTLMWMEKINKLLSDSRLRDTDILLKDSYSVSIVVTDFARKCGLHGDSIVTLSPSGLLISHSQKRATVIEWKDINDVQLINDDLDKNKTCVLKVDRTFQSGSGGELKLSGPLASDLANEVSRNLGNSPNSKKLSKSEGDLRVSKLSDTELAGEVRRSSWYSGPAEVSLDDIDIGVSKEARVPLPRVAARLLAPSDLHDDSMSDRRSLVSVASGIYEEIPDVPPTATASQNICRSTLLPPTLSEEPTYESVVECVYATMRRAPPPLPPRAPPLKPCAWGAGGAAGEGGGVRRHGSLGALPRCTTLPKPARRQPFSVFRKRLKSESRVASPPKAELSSGSDTKKKRFEFPRLRLRRSDAKSCEFLDETEHVAPSRCSKSVECLEEHRDLSDDLDVDLSIGYEDTTLALPQEIMDLIIKGREQFKIRLKDAPESDYLPMSPLVPPLPAEHQYMVMSPRTNLA